jgi:hypothetical protein
MSVSEFMTRRATVEAHYGSHRAFTSLVPVVDQMYQCVRTIAQHHFSVDMGRLLMLAHREFLVGCSLLQGGLPYDAGANTRRAIEIARLALAIKCDPANVEKWMQAERRQARWDARQAGEKPKTLPPFPWDVIEADPRFAVLKEYFGMYSDTYVHFSPEFIGQQHFDEHVGEGGIKLVSLRYFAFDRRVIQSTITICGIHGRILEVFDACFDNMISNDSGWKLLKATFDELGTALWKELPPDDDAADQ